MRPDPLSAGLAPDGTRGAAPPGLATGAAAGPGAAAVPTAAEWVVPAAWQAIDFISDLHLSDDTPRTFEAWQQHLLNTSADAVVILGDFLELWVGDDQRHTGVGARCVDALSRVSRSRTVAFMAGNRDFLIGADMLAACGARALADPTVVQAFGDRVLLTHGDALCLSDLPYQQFRAMVRQPAWQQQFLALPADQRLRIGAQVRQQSEQNKDGRTQPADWADVDAPEAVRWLQAAGAHTLVHGHTHRPGTAELAPGFVRHVLTDWDLDHPPARAEVLRWTASGLHRLPPAVAR